MDFQHNTRPSQAGPTSLASLEQSIVLRFEQVARLHPERIAVREPGATHTFGALNGAANRLARSLPGEDGAPVAVLQGHNFAAIAAFMAVLKAGRPLVLLHPAHPAERLRTIVADARPACLLAARAFQALAEQLAPPGAPLRIEYIDDFDLFAEAHDPGLYPPPESTFGIFYTSGSTGEPKGLVHAHRFWTWQMLRDLRSLELSPEDRVGVLSSLGFGAPFSFALSALLGGGAVCLFDFSARGPVQALDWMLSEEVTVLRLTPSVFRSIFERATPDQLFPSLRLITLGGEPARADDVRLFKQHTAGNCKLISLFSSTDAGNLASFTVRHDTIVSEEFLPPGHPAPGKEILLLDEAGQPVPPGATGEIVVRSAYLASGYHGLPGLTARTFRPDPGDPALKILYSGDLGRWRADGVLEFLGRKDSMVKIRGQRVDLAEVEAVVLEDPAIKEAVVIVRPNRRQPDQLQLIAYVVRQPGQAAAADELRRRLGARLPDYSVPAAYVHLEAMPLNVNGKIDRPALPEPPDRPELDPADLPADVLEQRLVDIWAGVLKLERLGVHDNFFEIGGDSLSVLSMSIEVERAFSVSIPRAFFRDPTVHHLARLLHEHAADDDDADFSLESHRHAPPDRQAALRLRRWVRRQRSGLASAYHSLNATYALEWVLAQRIRGSTFEAAREILARAADRPFVAELIFRKQLQLFERFLTSLDMPAGRAHDLFRHNLLANWLFRLIEARRPFQRLPFRRNLADLPMERMDELFPVDGLHHLQQALRLGRGAILLSFHGTAMNRLALHLIARRTGVSTIQTIAYNRARRQSYAWGTHIRPTWEPELTAWLHAEIAFHGQRLLERGEVIHIAGDILRGPGRTVPVQIGGRRYSLKPGFAELALNKHACIIPTTGRFLEDGRVLTELLPPLEPDGVGREQHIESLVRQYAAFMDACLRAHPEALTWRKQRNHLRFPPAGNSIARRGSAGDA